MSETNWTPEPWKLESGEMIPLMARGGPLMTPCLIGESGKAEYMERNLLASANVARAIACVNACTGIPDPAGEIERLRRVEVAAREVSDILFRASLSSNWNTHGVAILDAHVKLATALKEPANG